MNVITRDLVTSAMLEIGILGIAETPSNEDAAFVLQKIQRLIDRMNADRQAIYNVNFTLFNLQANHSPTTIGPGGDFDVTNRPVKIVAASFILNPGSGSTQVDTPIRIRDDQWWAANPTKQLTSDICTDLYYSPDVPLGNAYFWPICNINNPVRLEMWTNLVVPLTLDDTLYFPQGYWDAIVLSAASDLCSPFRIAPPPNLDEKQREAMRIIMGNNATPPRIYTDGGMPAIPAGGYGRPDFDFLTGLNDN